MLPSGSVDAQEKREKGGAALLAPVCSWTWRWSSICSCLAAGEEARIIFLCLKAICDLTSHFVAPDDVGIFSTWWLPWINISNCDLPIPPKKRAWSPWGQDSSLLKPSRRCCPIWTRLPWCPTEAKMTLEAFSHTWGITTSLSLNFPFSKLHRATNG